MSFGGDIPLMSKGQQVYTSAGYEDQSFAEKQPDMMEFIREQERRDGVRFVWNSWPGSKEEAAKMIVPLGVFVTPIKPRPDIPPFSYEPVYCAKCRAVLNPYSQADFRAKTWTCCFCAHRNTFPPHYAGASDHQRPPELLPQFSTMEYILPRPPMPPIFLFVVDTCLEEGDLHALKNSLLQAVKVIPKTALVGLVTFGRTISVHDLSMELIKHCYVFRGTKEITAKQLQPTDFWTVFLLPNICEPNLDQLGIGRYTGVLQSVQAQPKSTAGPTKFPNRFIQPIETCEKHINESIQNITRDPWPTATGKRPLRCTGAALNIAVGLVESSFPGTGARIMLFIGGPCTQGPGMVVGEELKIPIRSHHDIIVNNAPHVVKATKYYTDLATRAASNSHAIDIFSCALDQTGLHEMKLCCNMTGGQMLLADNFNSALFTQNMEILFTLDSAGNLPFGFNATTEIKASQNAMVSGCLGPVMPLKSQSSVISDTNLMGTGGTAEWKSCGLLHNTTLCFFFEPGGQAPGGSGQGNTFHLQFITSYQHSTGVKRVRVTTVHRNWVEEASPAIPAGFDQEAAGVLLARLAVTRVSEEATGTDIQRWIDRTLIRTCHRFGLFSPDDPNSFRLPDNFSLLPAAMFHLRRSQLLQTSNTSLDESAFYRHCLLKQDVTSGCIITQPVLYAYSLHGPPTLVNLDASSLQADRILLLDTFFHIVIYRGETIMQWTQAGYDKMAEYGHLASLLKAPAEDAQVILSTRFPMPRYVVTEQGGSQARFLLSKVNPSQNAVPAGYGWSVQQENVTPILTEDVSLQLFTEHLKKLAVSSTLN